MPRFNALSALALLKEMEIDVHSSSFLDRVARRFGRAMRAGAHDYVDER